MRMQVILDSSFARPGSAPIRGGKKGEFRDWTFLYLKILFGISFFSSVGSEATIVRFVFAPFSSWLANYGHVTISGIVVVLLAHGRFKYIKMFGDLSFHCILHKTTPMSKTPRPRTIYL